MSGRISVVVPVYDVEAYLVECLDSIAQQTVRDLDVVMVDDGSSDSSPEIAAGYAERDSRFRLIRQPNGGLGNARNTGSDNSAGELLMFVDSDDVLPPTSIEHMLTALDQTGSDFATGNVWRLRARGLEPSAWLAPVFEQTRLATHITRFRPLIANRVAWNKLWRRTFWDAHAFRFPEGVLYEDTPVTIPAHFLAKSVDVVSEPVYYWRARVGTDKSITQRRTQVKALTDRLQTIQSARDFLRSYPDEQARVWYDASILGDDLAPYLDLLRKGDDEFRQVFLDRVNAMLDDADPSIYDGLPGDLRRRWLLVRERDLDALLRLPPAAQQRRGPAPAGPKPKQPPTPSVARRVVRRVPRRVRRIVPVRLRRRLLGVMRGRRS